MGETFSAERLRSARLRAGLTQSDLAAQLRAKDGRLRVHNQRVSAWEQGRVTPRPYVAGLLAELLDMGETSVDGQPSTLRDLRTRLGLTLREVAGALGKSQRTLLRWEKGETRPPAGEVSRLADLYGVEAREIVRAVEESTCTRV